MASLPFATIAEVEREPIVHQSQCEARDLQHIQLFRAEVRVEIRTKCDRVCSQT